MAPGWGRTGTHGKPKLPKAHQFQVSNGKSVPAEGDSDGIAFRM